MVRVTLSIHSEHICRCTPGYLTDGSGAAGAERLVEVANAGLACSDGGQALRQARERPAEELGGRREPGDRGWGERQPRKVESSRRVASGLWQRGLGARRVQLREAAVAEELRDDQASEDRLKNQSHEEPARDRSGRNR